MNKQILLTWDAYNNGFLVTAKTLVLLKNNHGTNIDEIFYLQNGNLQEQNIKEIDAFYGNKLLPELLKKNVNSEELKKRINECAELGKVFKKKPNFAQKRIDIKGVTDYQSIFDKLTNLIKSEFYKPNIQLHINVSPGTPHMHVVWLMLNASGYLPDTAILWQSQLVKETNKTIVEKIKFKPRTFLSEILKSKYISSAEVVINPNDTISDKRKIAESKIVLFSSIPNVPILLLGERGTGKSTYVKKLIAKGCKNYAEVACGIFSENLMRSELFGYKKGSFTGANEDKDGILSKFKEGGILFLDEIHDLSKPLQRQLIQVLQTGEYFPIGSNTTSKTKFQLITASNIELSKLRKKLDSDFYDRVVRYIVEIPPLRDCRDDIRNYWQNVWQEVANFENAPDLIWNDELDNFLYKEDLLGNFRDLQKIASYIIAFYFETKNTEKAVNKAIEEYLKYKPNKDTLNQKGYFIKNKTHQEIIAKFEKDLTEWAIKEYSSKKEAAKILDRSEDMLNKYLNMNRLKNIK